MGVPISNVTRRVVYAASGTGPYAFTFEILANTDIAVYRDDTLLTLTTDYSVTIASNGTGSITLVAAPTGATQIAIVGNRTIQRTTDFVTGGDFFANTVNNEMDQQTIFAQQNAEGLQRALSAPQTDPTSINMTLPRASLRANKALGFDADGNPAIADTLGTNRGNWAASSLYYVRDIVKDTTNSNIWQCIVQHTSSGSQPINTNADSAKWTLLVDAAAAATSATNAAASASAAATSASGASSSASAASTSASNASTSASNASSSASAAASSASSAAASYDSFDDRYLGAKSSDPTLDNDSQTLIDGALYFDTTNNVMKVYDLGNTTWKRTTPTSSDQTNIDAAVANATNINTVAGISANVTTVATNNANVTTVATNIASVNTNATNIANINQNAANIAAIQTASSNATAAAASATSASGSATAAAASAAAASAVALGDEPVRPAIRPSLLLDFANSKELDPRITFTRASTATFYNGVTTAKAEENLMTRSQELGVGAWSTTNATITANSTAAPDGTTTADTLIDDTTSGAHICAQVVTMITSAVYTQSVFLKASTNNFAVVTLSSSVTNNYISAVVDLSTGAITQTSTGTSSTFTSSSITSVGNGWYRVVITGSTTGGFTRGEVGLAPAATGNSFATNGRITYAGTGTSIFVWGAQLEQRSAATAYTPTVTVQITNYIPALQTAAAGVARFDHIPTTFESLGLLIEEQRTNLILQSETFSTTWSATRSAITANTVVSPAGTLTADVLSGDTSSDPHFISQSVTTTATATTFSIYAKAAGRNFVALQISDSTNTGQVTYFNLSTGAVGTTGTGITASMVSVGNGWYRCIATVATAFAGSNSCIVAIADVDGSLAYTGNGYFGIHIWGAQVEAGAFPTSYISTVASQVTRAADAASMTGTNFSSWYNADQGTLYSEASTYDASVVRSAFSISDGSSPYRILTAHGTGARGFVANNGTQMSQTIASVAFSNNTFSKMSMAYAVNNGNAAANGTLGTLDTAMTIPVVTQLQIGSQTGSGSQTLNGTIKKLAYYPLRVTDAQLQGMTTV